jgi:hypothetical protein
VKRLLLVWAAVVVLVGRRNNQNRRCRAVKRKGAGNMTTGSTHFCDLAKEVRPPDKGIVSRTLSKDGRLPRLQ